MASITLLNTAAEINTVISCYYTRLTGNYAGPQDSSADGFIIRKGNNTTGIFIGNDSIDFYQNTFNFKCVANVSFNIPSSKCFFVDSSDQNNNNFRLEYSSDGTLAIGTSIDSTYKGLQVWNSAPCFSMVDSDAQNRSGDQSIAFFDKDKTIMFCLANRKDTDITVNGVVPTLKNETSLLYANFLKIEPVADKNDADNTNIILCDNYITLFDKNICTNHCLYVNGSAYFCNCATLSGALKIFPTATDVENIDKSYEAIEIIKQNYQQNNSDIVISSYSTGTTASSKALGGIKIRSASGTYANPSGTISGDYAYFDGYTTHNGTTWVLSSSIKFGAEVKPTSSNHQSYISFRTVSPSSKNSSEKVRISSAGYVGIGIDPAYHLDVVGSANIRETAYICKLETKYFYNTDSISCFAGYSNGGYHWFKSTPAAGYTDPDSSLSCGYGWYSDRESSLGPIVTGHHFLVSGQRQLNIIQNCVIATSGLLACGSLTTYGPLSVSGRVCASGSNNNFIYNNCLCLVSTGNLTIKSTTYHDGVLITSGYICTSGICSTGTSTNNFCGLICATGVVCASCFCTHGGAVLSNNLISIACFCQTGWSGTNYANCFVSNCLNIAPSCTGVVNALNTAKAWGIICSNKSNLTLVNSFNVKGISFGDIIFSGTNVNVDTTAYYLNSGFPNILYNQIQICLCNSISGTPVIATNVGLHQVQTGTLAASTCYLSCTNTGLINTSTTLCNQIFQTPFVKNTGLGRWHTFSGGYAQGRVSDLMLLTVGGIGYYTTTGLATYETSPLNFNGYINFTIYGR